MPTLVTGTITLPAGTPAFEGATVYVRLESVGMMGMSATTVAESAQRSVAYDGQALPFKLNGSTPAEDGRYNLRVHISMSGSDDVQKGDYITKQTVPVLADGAPDQAQAMVEKV